MRRLLTLVMALALTITACGHEKPKRYSRAECLRWLRQWDAEQWQAHYSRSEIDWGTYMLRATASGPECDVFVLRTHEPLVEPETVQWIVNHTAIWGVARWTNRRSSYRGAAIIGGGEVVWVSGKVTAQEVLGLRSCNDPDAVPDTWRRRFEKRCCNGCP